MRSVFDDIENEFPDQLMEFTSVDSKGVKTTENLKYNVRNKLEDDIYDIIIKSLCLATPQLKHLMFSCQPNDVENSMCF